MADHPVRIVRFHHSLDPRRGGIVASLLATTAALQQCHHVTIVTHDPDPQYHAPFLRVGADVRVAVGLTSSARAIDGEADLVILEGAWSRAAPAIALRCRQRRVPYLYVPHGSLSSAVRDQFPGKHRKKMAYWLAVGRWIAAGAAAVWFSSETERTNSVHTFPGMTPRFSVIPFVSREPTGNARRPGPTEPLRIVTAARVSPVKDLDVLIRALALPGAGDWHVTIAGDDEPTHVAGLHRLATDLGVADRIQWWGFLSPEQLDELFARSHLYVCPGLESFGMSVAEALGANLPVVTSEAVALAPVLGAAGETFPRGDVTALGHAISRAEEGLRGHYFADTPCRVWHENFSPEAFLAHFTAEILDPILERG